MSKKYYEGHLNFSKENKHLLQIDDVELNVFEKLMIRIKIFPKDYLKIKKQKIKDEREKEYTKRYNQQPIVQKIREHVENTAPKTKYNFKRPNGKLDKRIQDGEVAKLIKSRGTALYEPDPKNNKSSEK